MPNVGDMGCQFGGWVGEADLAFFGVASGGFWDACVSEICVGGVGVVQSIACYDVGPAIRIVVTRWQGVKD